MTKIFTKIGATLYDNSLWQVPSDRTFRDAWASAGENAGVINVNMDKAKEIWRDKSVRPVTLLRWMQPL